MPSVPLRTLAVVVRNFQLMWGRPRTSTIPMMPATSAMTRMAAAQTAAVKKRFQALRAGENVSVHRGLLLFSTTFSTTLMSMMKTNSTSAMLNSACFCRPLA